MNLNIFFISLCASIIALCAERMLGIDWDYHVDAQTYIYSSEQIWNDVLEMGLGASLNAGYYFISNLFGQSVMLLTTLSFFSYAATNQLIYNIHSRFINKRNDFSLLLLLILFNPYRLHLSTTILKDNLIILLLSIVTFNFRKYYVAFVALVFLRIASIFYFILFTKRSYLLMLSMLGVIIYFFAPEYFDSRLQDSVDVNLHSRDFDTIPTFQEYGLAGNYIRGIVWAILSVTGLFAIMSFAPEFLFVSIGIIATYVYWVKASRKLIPSSQVFISLFIFAILAPGFTSYIRYVLPILTLYPFIYLMRNEKK